MDDIVQESASAYEPRGRLDPAGLARHVRFLTYPPPADLAPFIEPFWAIFHLLPTCTPSECNLAPSGDVLLRRGGTRTN